MLEEAIWRWRQQLTTRVVMYLLAAVISMPIAGWRAVLAWCAAFVAFQLAVALLMRPKADGIARSGRTAPVGVTLVLLHNLFAAILVVIIASSGSQTALVVGYGLAAMSLVAVVVGSGGQGALFLAGAVPLALALLVGLPFCASATVDRMSLLSLEAGAFATVATSFTLWRWQGQLLRDQASARRSAEAAVDAKSRLVATISHELRTPISAIQAGAMALGPKQPQGDLILQASRMMRTLLDDLLDHSKLEAGRLSVERIDFDLRRALAQTARFWRAEARQKGIRLGLHTQHLPAAIVGDETRLRQILNNLLSNALKFSAGKPVNITASYEAGCLRIEVADMGIGMSEAQLDRLFQPFAQADDSVARVYGGTGLGLSISRDLAVAMGGGLTVSSRLGVGSAFAVSIPAPLGSVATPEIPEAEAEALQGLRILVADDHEVNRRVMELFLSPIATLLVLAEDGHAALEALAVEPFDVVLLDVCMPGLDGYETARRMRLAPGPNRATPIIAVTGALGADDEARRRDAGMDGVVAKPVDPRELLSVLAAAGAARDATATADFNAVA